jgi:DNA-binding NtrC family response regulator
MDKYTDETHQSKKVISPKAMEMLLRYDWPGNVRELQNMIERAVVLNRSETLTPKSFSFPDRPRKAAISLDDVVIPEEGLSLMKVVEEIEKGYLKKALIQAGGVQIKAAELLHITRKILRYKMEKYDI